VVKISSSDFYETVNFETKIKQDNAKQLVNQITPSLIEIVKPPECYNKRKRNQAVTAVKISEPYIYFTRRWLV